MNVIMKREVFNSIADQDLIWACIEPAIQPLRGRNFQVKSQGYSQLTAAQRALFMFQVFYGHIRNGIAEFFDHTAYFLAEPGVWSEFKAGMRYFGDDDMLRLLEEIERLSPMIKELTKDHNDTERETDHHSTIPTTIKHLDSELHQILPETVHRIGVYIRNHSGEFLQIVD